MTEAFPYLLSTLGVTALFVIGRGLWWGWLVALTNECLWVFFALATGQHGFLLGAFVYGIVNAFNAVRWLGTHPHKGRQTH